MDCFHCLMRVWSETSDHQDEHMLYEFAYILIFQPIFFFYFQKKLKRQKCAVTKFRRDVSCGQVPCPHFFRKSTPPFSQPAQHGGFGWAHQIIKEGEGTMLRKLPFRIISSFLCLSGQSSCCRCSYFPSPSFLMQTLSLFLKTQNTLSQAYNKRLSSRFIAFFTCATPYSTVMTILRFQAWVTCGLRKNQRKLGTNEWSFSPQFSPSLPVAIDKTDRPTRDGAMGTKHFVLGWP